jgi:two-component system response regulator DesR
MGQPADRCALPGSRLKEMTLVRVLLVEPMSLLRGALSAVLSAEDDLEVVGELGRLDDAVGIARRLRPDVALVDLGLLVNTGGGAVDRLREEVPGCAVVMLVDVDTPGAVRGELETRVHGFIGKDTPPDQLADYIRQAARGERVIDPTLAVAAWHAPRNPLSSREIEVLRVAADGLTSVEIANKLHLSVGTVRNYLSSILRKTGARTRLEAVRIATEAGWL